MSKRHTKLVHKGEYAVEVEVELITTGDGWSAYCTGQRMTRRERKAYEE